MKIWQFIIFLLLNLLFIGAGIYGYLDLSDKIDSVKIEDTKKDNSTEIKSLYGIDEKEFKRLIYGIEEDAKFCRAGIVTHREEWRERTEDYTKLFLNTFK